MSALWAEGITFSSFVSSKEEKVTKRRKDESRGIPIFPLDNPLLKTATQGPRPLCGEPQGNARGEDVAEIEYCRARWEKFDGAACGPMWSSAPTGK